MLHSSLQILYFLLAVIFISVVFANLTKKNSSAVILYMIQSAAVATLLSLSSLDRFSYGLLVAIGATVLVKIIVAPYFFFGLIRKHKLQFSATTYLNLPLSLVAISILTALSHANFFSPLSSLGTYGQSFLQIAFAAISISLLLIVNRKGILSQMLGILSLENSIVTFALLAGLEESPLLQIGITFDILVWVIMASIFASMVYQKIGSLDVSEMNELTEQ